MKPKIYSLVAIQSEHESGCVWKCMGLGLSKSFSAVIVLVQKETTNCHYVLPLPLFFAVDYWHFIFEAPTNIHTINRFHENRTADEGPNEMFSNNFGVVSKSRPKFIHLFWLYATDKEKNEICLSSVRQLIRLSGYMHRRTYCLGSRVPILDWRWTYHNRFHHLNRCNRVLCRSVGLPQYIRHCDSFNINHDVFFNVSKHPTDMFVCYSRYENLFECGKKKKKKKLWSKKFCKSGIHG